MPFAPAQKKGEEHETDKQHIGGDPKFSRGQQGEAAHIKIQFRSTQVFLGVIFMSKHDMTVKGAWPVTLMKMDSIGRHP